MADIEAALEASNVTTLRTDAVVAADLRGRMIPLLEQMTALMNEAKGYGLILNFQLGMDGFGRARVQDMSVVKPL